MSSPSFAVPHSDAPAGGAATGTSDELYLSVVVATRNDNHCGDPLQRLQAFVNCFDEQCRRTGLDAEVIVVEWNPPPERRSVGSLLRLPYPSFCTYRFIEVPPDIHRRLRYADKVPLFEMIAKNVGIRRARGRFVLATNIDIIFSTELVDFIASQQLQPGFMYRVDRHDVQSHFPIDAPLDAQMSYCASHRLRVHTRRGSDVVGPSERSSVASEGISDGRTVRLGGGWHASERGAGSRPYGGGDCAEIIVNLEAAGISDDAVLELTLESNPYDEVELLAVENDRQLLQTRIAGRTRVGIRLPKKEGVGERRIELRGSRNGATPPAHLQAVERSDAVHYRVSSARVRAASDSPTFAYPPTGWTKANPESSLELTPAGDHVLVTTEPRRWSYCAKYGLLLASRHGLHTFEVVYKLLDGQVIIGALSGDETAWLPSSLRLHQSARLHQIEIALDLRRGQRFWLMISNDHPDGDGVSRFVIQRLESPVDAKAVLVPNRRERPVDRLRRKLREHRPRWRPRTSIRALANRITGGLAARIGERLRSRMSRVTELKSLEQALQASDDHPGALAAKRDLNAFNIFLRARSPDSLHVNACGDFQLMARQHWNQLRAYPELETLSMNIGGLFSCIADAAGIREQQLDMPIYHLDHRVSSDRLPASEALRLRIAELGITQWDLAAASIVARCTRWLRRPVMFNAAGWGFVDEAFVERTVTRQVPRR